MIFDLDNPETWICNEISTPPSGVDVPAYQSRIDAICGKAANGQSNVKLTWMPAQENYAPYYSTWDDAGFGKKFHLRAKYVFNTFWETDANKNLIAPLDLAPPRWALQQRIDPAQYAQDDLTRWAKKQDGDATTLRELRPPKPRDGYYAPLLSIGKHNGHCCKEAKKERIKCWGQYRAPDDHYLTLLKEAVAQRDAEGAQRTDAPLSPSTLVQAAVEAAAFTQAKALVGDAWLDNLIDENLDALVAHFTGIKRDKAIVSI